METYFIYFLQTSFGIVLFYILYLLLLKNETFYHTNRYFLIAGLICAALLPLFPISYASPIAMMNNADFFSLAEVSAVPDSGNVLYIQTRTDSGLLYAEWLLGIYLAGMAFFFIRLVWQTIRISWKIRHSECQMIDGVKVINQHTTLPFSFFNVVFIDIQEYSERELSNIIAHEKVHIQERHWVDLLIIELLTVLFWINPVVWLYEKSIKQNHEYLADQGVLLAGYSPGQYQALLINQLMGVKVLGFAHNLNFSLNKKRMEMMKKKKSPGFKKVKLLITLPVVAILIFAFAKPDYIIVDEFDASLPVQESIDEKEMISVKGIVIDEDGSPMTGANVILKDTNTGTVVDRQGEFEIDIPSDGTLVVSFLGYKTVSANLPLNGNVEIKMEKRTFNIELPDVNDPNFKMQLPPPPPPKDMEKQDNNLYRVFENMPFYTNGGMSGLALDLKKEIKRVLDKTKDRGEAMVGFTVAANGKIVNPHITKSANSEMLDASAIKIIAKLDNWWAAIQRDKRVPVDLAVPVKFE